MVLNDKTIARLAVEKEMISPFIPTSINQILGTYKGPVGPVPIDYKALSFGTSSYGYDVRLSREIKIFTNINGCIVDPKNLDHKTLVDAEVNESLYGIYTVLPPNSYLLGRTMEYFKIPRDVLVIAVGKSTLARAGVLINVTPIEPGFEGEVVIEVANCTSLPIKIYLEEGISQFIFFSGEPCEVSYGDRAGKYQGQRGIMLPKV